MTSESPKQQLLGFAAAGLAFQVVPLIQPISAVSLAFVIGAVHPGRCQLTAPGAGDLPKQGS